MNCDVAREYCGAVADGELELVPAPVLEHIHACPDCSVEVEWQREAQVAVAAALVAPLGDPVPAPARWRWATARMRWAVGVAAVVAVGLAVIGLRADVNSGSSAEAAMLDASHSFGSPAGIVSGDRSAVEGWTAGVGVPVQVMPIKGDQLTGARLSRVMNHGVMTLIFAGSGGRVEVSMVPARYAAQWPDMEAKAVDHRPVGLLRHGQDSLIIVAGTDAQLHATMALLQG
ncbi:MAG TPA: hypothetical protein VNV65_10025 [Candidatus Solibacter sp.]|nr:hypothetical protein [Candidatus Solibacter sp.]